MVKLMMMEVSEETGRRMLNCPTSANGIHLAVASNNDGSDAIVWVGVRTTSSEGTETIHMLKPVKVAADSVVQDLRRGVIRAFAPSLDEVAPNHLDLYYGDAVLAPNAPLALYEATETNPLWLSPQVLLGTGTTIHFFASGLYCSMLIGMMMFSILPFPILLVLLLFVTQNRKFRSCVLEVIQFDGIIFACLLRCNNRELEATNGFKIGDQHSRRSKGAFGLVMDAEKNGRHDYVAKFFGYTEGLPDTDWILREIQNLTQLRGIEGVVQIEGTFNDSRTGMLSNRDEPLKSHKKVESLQTEVYPVIVLEKLTGATLIDGIVNSGMYFCEQDAARIFKSVMTTIRDIHFKRNMINIDFKVDNLVFQSENLDGGIKIVDFGMGVHLLQREKHYDKNLLGTRSFIAPESILTRRLTGQAVYSRKSDIWQAGCILYILLTGHYPFQPEEDTDTYRCILRGEMWMPIDQLHVSADAKDLLAAMFKQNPDERIDANQILEQNWLRRDPCTLPADHRVDFSGLRTLMQEEFERVWGARKGPNTLIRSNSMDGHESLKEKIRKLKHDFIRCCEGPVSDAPGTKKKVVIVEDSIKLMSHQGISKKQYMELFSRQDGLTHLANDMCFDSFDMSKDEFVDYFECLYGVTVHEMDGANKDYDVIARLFFCIVDIKDCGTVSSDVVEHALWRYFGATTSKRSLNESQVRRLCEAIFHNSPEITENMFVEKFANFMNCTTSYCRSLSLSKANLE
jgi:serine/threonine protein kinase/intracellular sulfur oxidation DsrE/DsrF family protein